MKQPNKPTLTQKKIISKAGLDPDKWSVTMEDADYLHLVERHFEKRDIRIIDKKTMEVMKENALSRPKQSGQKKNFTSAV